MIRRPPRSTLSSSSAASDVYKRQGRARFGKGIQLRLEFAGRGVESLLLGRLRGDGGVGGLLRLLEIALEGGHLALEVVPLRLEVLQFSHKPAAAAQKLGDVLHLVLR